MMTDVDEIEWRQRSWRTAAAAGRRQLGGQTRSSRRSTTTSAAAAAAAAGSTWHETTHDITELLLRDKISARHQLRLTAKHETAAWCKLRHSGTTGLQRGTTSSTSAAASPDRLAVRWQTGLPSVVVFFIYHAVVTKWWKRKIFLSHTVALIFVFLEFSQTPVYTARSRSLASVSRGMSA